MCASGDSKVCEKSEIFIGLDIGSCPVMNSGKGNGYGIPLDGGVKLSEKDILVRVVAKIRFGVVSLINRSLV